MTGRGQIRSSKVNEKRRYGRRHIDLSVPFDIDSSNGEADELNENDYVCEDKSLVSERRRRDIMNEEDFLMEIKAHPGEAMPIIKYIQYKMEINENDAPKRIFNEFLPRIEGEEKDKLCISFINYLMFIHDPEYMRVIKRLSKICSPSFLSTIASNTSDIQILRLYFERSMTKTSFGMYLECLLNENVDEANGLIRKNTEFLSVSIDLIYKYLDNPRMRVEKLLTDRKDVWMAYIKNESGAYLRSLYRRVVDRKWKVGEMKEFYKMWLKFEKESSGNVDEVKLRAKEYVESINNK